MSVREDVFALYAVHTNSTLRTIKELAPFSQDTARIMVTLTMALTRKLEGAETGQWTEPCKRNQTQWTPKHPSVVNSMGTKK